MFDNSGGGIKVITESMGEPWYDDMEKIMDEFLDKLVKRAAVGGLIAAIAAYIGGMAGVVVAAAGALLAFSDEIAAAYSGSDLEVAVNKYIDVHKEAATKLEKEIANL